MSKDLAIDGFDIVDPGRLSSGQIFNISRFRNQLSPFCEEYLPRDDGIKNVLVDRFYGLAYDAEVLSRYSVYGKVEMLPEYSGDSLANFGFLRVPFRRIPRVLVKNRSELDQLIASIQRVDPNLKLFFRGQNSEHYIKRREIDLKHLYGDEKSLEPSLLPSASRAGVRLETILPQWCALLRMHIESIIGSNALSQEVERKTINLLNSYSFSLLALALAQHYGLPSAGLDVTNDIDVALFFATRAFTSIGDDGELLSTRHQALDKKSVIYLLSPFERYSLDYKALNPGVLKSNRPNRQSAYFVHSGWGSASNECARHLFMAIYLDDIANFESKYSSEILFPSVEEDDFFSFLKSSRSLQLDDSLKSYLKRLYHVKDANYSSKSIL